MKSTLLKLGVGVFFASLFLGVVAGKVKAEPYGWSPNVDNSWQGTPTCGDSKPDKAPILFQPNHPVLPKPKEKGAIRLRWTKVPDATGYNVYYGLTPGNYIFTAPDLPDTDNYTVTHLANRVYYFAVQAKRGCAASGLSNEWPGRPTGMGGGYIARAGIARGFVPVVSQTTSAVTEETVNPSPTAAAQVQGVTTEFPSDTSYQPPTEVPYNPPAVPKLPKPTPKPSLWQAIMKFLGLSR